MWTQCACDRRCHSGLDFGLSDAKFGDVEIDWQARRRAMVFA
jgi:hypothetical protein